MDQILWLQFVLLMRVVHVVCFEVSDVLDVAIPQPDDIVRELVANIKSHVLQCRELIALRDQTSEEVAWQFQRFVGCHVDDFILR